MGCSGSKLEDLEAVALCRGRTDHLADAIRHRYALADSHAAYAASLRSVAASLHRFLDSAANHGSLSSSSPLLSLPTQRKGDPLPPPSPPPPAAAAAHSRSHSSGSGSHIQFHSSDSDDDGGSGSISADSDDHFNHQHHLDLHDYYQAGTLGGGGGPTSFMNFHYARSQPPPPSVSFEQRPEIPQPVNFSDPSSSSSSSYPTNYNYPNDSNYSYPYDYPSNNYYGFFAGSSSSLPPPNLRPSAGPTSSAPKPPPLPPSPPRASTWDFLNPFEGQDSYYQSYTPSQSSREVRDEEGIPDLEEEEHEVVKEVYGDQKFVASTSGDYNESNDEGIGNVDEDSKLKGRRSVEAENEEDVVEKKVVIDEVQQQRPQQNVGSASNPRKYHDVSEIGSEIRIQFERALDAVAELSKMLEVGKHPYHYRKSSVIEVSSMMMMCVMSPSTSNGEEFLNFEEDIAASSGNLSSTLQKLYIWEKKLQDEVRAEEKLRLLHDRNCKRLRHLIQRGAEAHKLEEVQKLIKKLSTKIRIAIQVVDSISSKINTLRDEELWPQIDDLIKGLVRMWKVMLECHRIQCHAISEAKNIDSIFSREKLDDSRLNAILELELELLRWTGNFSSWINAQKKYVKALNGWLGLCLRYEPVVTDDGIAPYSPGRIGAPAVFVICNYWSQAMDVISEKEVINSMQAFSINLRRIWEQHTVGTHHKMMPNGDMDRLVKARERESQIIQKEVDALSKKLVLVSGQNDLQDYSSEVSSLQLGLKQIFEAMENFTANSLKAYEDLHARSEEEKVAGENAKLS